MKKSLNRKGFTLAEVLIVVAIIVVLAGVGFIALFYHMRTMHQLEMDGQAKELFIAAQNHLSLAESQGYLGKSDFGTADTVEPNKDIYYYVYSSDVGADDPNNPDNKDSVLNQMLPFAAVDETARTGGSYIIRYQKSSGTILDVFYASSDSRYGFKFVGGSDGNYTSVMNTRSDKNKRRNYPDAGGAVLGYYGGTQAAELKSGQPLTPPTVEVFNTDTLYVKVTDPNQATTGPNGGKNMLQLVVTGASSGAKRVITLYDGETHNPDGDTRVDNNHDNPYIITLDSVTGTVNDHFCNLASTNSNAFWPGEDLEIQGISLNNEMLTNIAESETYTANSLFADLSGTKDGSGKVSDATVGIANFRHLLNLDKTYVSNLSTSNITVTKAVQSRNLDWSTFTNPEGITAISGSGTVSGKYLPVATGYVLEYDGGSHRISNVVVNVTGDGGLFSSLPLHSNIHDLELVDFTVDAGGNAGALVGTLVGSTSDAKAAVTGVLVHNSKIGTDSDTTQNDDAYYIKSTGGSAGGLVGSLSGGKVEGSAAAVYVDGKNNAGGLIGTVTDTTTVTSSYSGGHTVLAKYKEENASLLTGDGRVNVYSESGSAGGLVGDASGAVLTISYSYSTSSVKGKTYAGGLLGKGGTGTAGEISYCYAIGRVYSAEENADAFLGSKGTQSLKVVTVGGVETPTNYFLEGISDCGSQDGLKLIAATTGDTGYSNFILASAKKKSAIAYDHKVGGRYDFPTVQQLHSENGHSYTLSGLASSITGIHYGDWQMPTLDILNYILVNADTLYTEISLKATTTLVTVAVCGETSQCGTAYLLRVSGSNVTVEDVGTKAATATALTWAGSAPSEKPATVITTSGSDKTLTVTLDDITVTKGQFANLFTNLTPGENFTLLVGGGRCGWSELTSLRTKVYPEDMDNPGQYIALSDNSLFAKSTALAAADTARRSQTPPANPFGYEPYENALTSVAAAEIKNIRHLQNLDTDVSNVNASTGSTIVTSAKLMNDLSWKDSFNGSSNKWSGKSICMYGAGSTAAGCFNGIHNAGLTSFSGNYKSIKYMYIGTTYGVEANSAGLFRKVDSAQNLTIQNLYLDSPIVEAVSNGAAGAFVAVNNGTLHLLNVLAQGEQAEDDKNYKINGSGVVGGLVGITTGESLEIWNSASSMLLGGNSSTVVGGLLGHQKKLGDGENKVTITCSYVGGHVNNRKYYVGEGDGRWNIISSGAAGGLIGQTDADTETTIEKTFNAASVFGASGKAGGLIGVANGSFQKSASAKNYLENVYVVAPVSSVGKVTETGETPTYTASTGDSGSVIGSTTSSIADVQAFYLLDAYTNPYPVQYTGNYTNILPIGSYGSLTLESVVSALKPASYYQVSSGASIIGMDDTATLVVKTKPFKYEDSKITGYEEYPFKIWTHFAFNISEDDSYTADEGDSGQADQNAISSYLTSNKYPLYYVGDWQPNDGVTMVVLDIHYVTVIPDDGAETQYKVMTFTTQEDQLNHVRVQIPYRTAKLALRWPDDRLGYTLETARWDVYIGDWTTNQSAWSANNINVMTGDAYKKSDYFFDTYALGENVSLSPTDFQKLNKEENYRKEGGSVYYDNGVPHIDLTCICTYKQDEYVYFPLNFYDWTFDTATNSYKTADKPCATVMLKARKTDLQPEGANAGTMANLDALKSLKVTGGTDLLNPNIEAPNRYLAGYRFLGWKYQANSEFAFTNTLNETTETFSLSGLQNGHMIQNLEPGVEIKLVADYKQILKRKLTISFVDENRQPVNGIDDYVIEFEADRGFSKTLTLPTWGIHVPDKIISGDTANVQMKTGSSEVAVGFDQVPPTITFQIGKMTADRITQILGMSQADAAAAKDLSFTIQYKRGTEAGYVVLFELLHTGSGDGYPYSPSDKAVYGGEASFDDINSYKVLYGVTEPGEAPTLNLGDSSVRAGLMEFINKKIVCDTDAGSLEKYFELTTYINGEGKSEPYRLVKLDNGVPQEYKDKYPAQVTVTGKQPAPVKYLIVVQCARVKWDLNFNSMDGSLIDTEQVEYGQPLNMLIMPGADDAHKPVRANFTFLGWQTEEMQTAAKNEVINSANVPKMKAKATTVYALWQGEPTGFTVAYWYENANDTDQTDYAYAGKRVYSDEEARTLGINAGSWISSDQYNFRNEFAALDDRHYEYPASPRIDVQQVRADRSTVLNVYFDRKRVNVTFDIWYKEIEQTQYDTNYGTWKDTQFYHISDDPKNAYPLFRELKPGELVVKTDESFTVEMTYKDTEEVRYGLMDGQYFPLTYRDDTVYKWTPVGYTPYTTETDRDTGLANNNVYGLLSNGEYVKLEYGPIGSGTIWNRVDGGTAHLTYQSTNSGNSSDPRYGIFESLLGGDPYTFDELTWTRPALGTSKQWCYWFVVWVRYNDTVYKAITADSFNDVVPYDSEYTGTKYTVNGYQYYGKHTSSNGKTITWFPIQQCPAESGWYYMDGSTKKAYSSSSISDFYWKDQPTLPEDDQIPDSGIVRYTRDNAAVGSGTFTQDSASIVSGTTYYYYDGRGYAELALTTPSTGVSGTGNGDFYDGVERYTGTRYKRENGGEPYADTIYRLTSEGFQAVETEDFSELDWEHEVFYGLDPISTNVGSDGVRGHVKLRIENTEEKYVWMYYNAAGKKTEHSGNLAYFVSSSRDATGITMTWTGKYESTFETNHYSWTMVDRFRWKEKNSNTYQTYMEAFVQDTFKNGGSTYALTCTGNTGRSEIRHYRQALDGSYPSYVVAYTSGETGTFIFSNKFSEFTVDHYQCRGVNGTPHVRPNDRASVRYPLNVYHTRNSYNLRFVNYNKPTDVGTEPLLFETPLDSFELPSKYWLTDADRPTDLPKDFHFQGWCLDATMGGKTVMFANGTGKAGVTADDYDPTAMLKMTMPAGSKANETGLVLYAKWARNPVSVSFSLAAPKLLAADGTTLSSLNVNLSWKEGGGSADKTHANLPWGSTLTNIIVDENTGWLSDAYKPADPAGYKFLYWVDSAGKRFYNTQALTDNYTLLSPVFEVQVNNTVTVDVFYKIGANGERQPDQTGLELTVGTTKMITLQNPPTSGIEGKKLDPPYYFDLIDEDWKKNHTYNSETEHYELTFTYVDANAEWTYLVEYYVMLEPENSTTKVPVKLLTETKKTKATYVFEAFYSLPQSMGNGYVFDSKELWKGSEKVSDYTAQEARDATVLFKKDEADVIRVFVEPMISNEIFKEIILAYNGKPQAISNGDIKAKLPKVGSDLVGTNLTVEPVDYEITQTYYLGSSKTPITNPQLSIVNAGIYRVELVVKLVYTTNNSTLKYKYVVTDDYDGSRPSITLIINRRKVTVTSGSVTDVFDKDKCKKYFNSNDTPNTEAYPKLPESAKLDDLAKNTTKPTVIDEYEANKIGIFVNKLDTDDPTDYSSLQSAVSNSFSINFSADAFRRTPSTSATDYTPNVFSVSINGADPNNFDVYKNYGKLFLWNDYDTYVAYAGN